MAARLFRLVASFPVSVEMSLVLVATFFALLPIFIKPVTLVSRSNARITPPRISRALTNKVTLSTPLQSPFLMASQFGTISLIAVSSPWSTMPAPASFTFPVSSAIPVATFTRPDMTAVTLSKFWPSVTILLIPSTISPIPVIILSAPPIFSLPRTASTVLTPLANSKRRSTTSPTSGIAMSSKDRFSQMFPMSPTSNPEPMPPPTPPAPPPPPPAGSLMTFSSSMPSSIFLNFAADPVAESMDAPASSAPPITFSNVASLKLFSIPKNDAIAFANRVTAFAAAIAHGMTICRMGINRLPTARAASVNAAFRRRSWFMGESMVLARSPWVCVTCVIIA